MKKYVLIYLAFLACGNTTSNSNKSKLDTLNTKKSYFKDSSLIINQTLIKKEKINTGNNIAIIQDFYSTFYSDENKDFSFDEMQEFVSQELIKKIDSLQSDPENLILDYDPFIQAQDFSGNDILQTLSITQLKESNTYKVQFKLFNEEPIKDNKREIDLQLKDEKGKMKINKILNSKYLN